MCLIKELQFTFRSKTQASEDRVDDVNAVGHPVWVLSRKTSEESVILMPDFGYWSWAKSNIGTYGQVVERIMATESKP
jgi:hypothetical protein